MKILHTVQHYTPATGGSEEVVRQISEHLAARGHEVTVATSHHSKRKADVIDGVQVVSFDINGSTATGVSGEIDAYREFVASADVDVMMNYAAQNWSTDLVLDLLEQLPFPRVLVPCGYTMNDTRFDRYLQELPRYLRQYQALVYMSRNYQDKVFGDLHGVGDRAVIIPNAAATEEFCRDTPDARKLFDVKTPFFLLTVGNHFATKGHVRLIKAFRQLNRPDASLVLIGEVPTPPWRGCFRYCWTSQLLDHRIKVLTGVPRLHVVAAFKSADVFVFASEVECAPLVIYEAMAAGLPFVSTNCGNVADHADAGIVVDAIEELAPCIDELLNNPQRRKAMSERGRSTWFASHTWEKVADAYEHLYERLRR